MIHVKPRTPTGRPHRVAELLRERLALILLHKCADPRLKELTLTEVEMSPDLKQARVFYAARENVDRDQVQIALDKALGFIKQEIGPGTPPAGDAGIYLPAGHRAGPGGAVGKVV